MRSEKILIHLGRIYHKYICIFLSVVQNMFSCNVILITFKSEFNFLLQYFRIKYCYFKTVSSCLRRHNNVMFNKINSQEFPYLFKNQNKRNIKSFSASHKVDIISFLSEYIIFSFKKLKIKYNYDLNNLLYSKIVLRMKIKFLYHIFYVL